MYKELAKSKGLLDKNFQNSANDLPGIQNTPENRELIKTLYLILGKVVLTETLDIATPGGDYDLLNYGDIDQYLSCLEGPG